MYNIKVAIKLTIILLMISVVPSFAGATVMAKEEKIEKTDIIEEVEEVEKVEKKSDKKDKSDKVKKTKQTKKYSDEDLRLLSALVYAEAGGESYDGKLAVANVVNNRVKSKVFSHVKTIKEVIYDKKWSVQFAVIKKNSSGVSPIDKALNLYDTGKYPGRNNKIEKKVMQDCVKAAKAILEGENFVDYLSFNMVNSSTSKIKNKYSNYKIIDNQIFYRTK